MSPAQKGRERSTGAELCCSASSNLEGGGPVCNVALPGKEHCGRNNPPLGFCIQDSGQQSGSLEAVKGFRVAAAGCQLS